MIDVVDVIIFWKVYVQDDNRGISLLALFTWRIIFTPLREMLYLVLNIVFC